MDHQDPEGMITALIAMALAAGVWLADPVPHWDQAAATQTADDGSEPADSLN